MRWVALLIILSSCIPNGDKPLLKAYKKVELDIKEPSDLCITPDGKTIYAVTDRGKLYSMDTEGQNVTLLAKSKHDLESLTIKNGTLYMVDEGSGNIFIYNALKGELDEVADIKARGEENEGFEGMVYIPERDVYVLVKERNPAVLYVYDADFDQMEATQIKSLDDVSGVTWHDDHLWLLSDENAEVIKVDPDSKEVVARYTIRATNAEGLCFLPNGDLVVASDENATLYYFKLPQ